MFGQFLRFKKKNRRNCIRKNPTKMCNGESMKVEARRRNEKRVLVTRKDQ
jgi:hypothetical protein